MEKQPIRREIVDEVRSQFETKLREVRRQKTTVEEELESATERWKAERRRLNAEIDRLTALSKHAATAPSAADEKIKKAASEWATERTRLTKQIARLESAVADAIERSSNPLRAIQPLKEQFEVRLEDAAKSQTIVEQQLLRLRAEWDEDRKRLNAEVMRLRRLAPSDKALEAKEKLERLRGRKETLEETRIRELERKLSESHTEIQQLHKNILVAREEEAARCKSLANETLQATRDLWEQERNELLAQIQQLHRGRSESNDIMNSDVIAQLRQQYDQQLHEIIQQKTELTQELQSATQLLASERSHFSEEAMQSKTAGPSADALAVEVRRVETTIQQIIELIDNPGTELSTVIRKNVEKAELDAYLKGILFTLGRGSGL